MLSPCDFCSLYVFCLSVMYYYHLEEKQKPIFSSFSSKISSSIPFPFLLIYLIQFSFILPLNRSYKVDFILLAGYLKLIPTELIRVFPKSILNIHPSLLPAFGGKGYYGIKVHKAVIASGARYEALVSFRVLLLLYTWGILIYISGQ